MRLCVLRALALCVVFFMPVLSVAANVQVSGGADGRYVNTGGDTNTVVLEGLFLNVRKVYSDEQGDRVIAVGQIDFDDNFETIRPYQTYLQYKGPLGKWNVRAGHYILPFGLLSAYDSERLLLRTLEPLSLGIKLDTGVELLGFFGDVDYAVSVSQGVGRNRLIDVDDNKLVTGRLGWQGENVNIGVSALIGSVLLEKDSIIRQEMGSNSLYEKRLGIDLTAYSGPLIVRGEVVAGKDDGKTVGGGLLKADYALTPKLELNLKYAHWQREGGRNFLGAGFSYEVYKGLFLRIADEYQFGKEDVNVAAIQTYFEFARQF